MTEGEDFLLRATFCLTFAETVTDPSCKAAIQEMATKWKELADRALHREQSPPSLATMLTAEAKATERKAGV